VRRRGSNTKTSAPRDSSDSRAPVAPSDAFLADLRRDVDELKKEHSGPLGWIRTWGAVAALVLSVLSVPRTVADLWNIRTRPQIDIKTNPALALEYDPARMSFKFAFDWTIANYGTRDDVVTNIKGTLMAPPHDTAILRFDVTDFSCSSQDKSMPIPFPIAHSSPSSIHCEASARVGPDSRRRLHLPGRRQIIVTVTGDGSGSKLISYCFEMSAPTIAEFLDQETLSGLRELETGCSES
jgi:hypothetical protein